MAYNIVPFDQDLSQVLMNFARNRSTVLEKAVTDLQSDRELTFSLLRDIQAGNVDPARLSISDDGWRLMPEEPEEDGQPPFPTIQQEVEEVLAEV